MRLSIGIALLLSTIGFNFPARAGDSSPDEKGNRSVQKLLRGASVASVQDLQLTDYQGKEWKLSEVDSKNGVVFAFLGTQCPLAKLYTSRIAELANTYEAKGIRFIAVDSNVQDSLAEMAAHAKKFRLELPFLKDPAQQLAGSLGATRTPEVCVVDSEWNLVYRGRIDDQYGIGYTKDKPSSKELVEVIESLLNSKPVTVAFTDAPGCLIGKNKKPAVDGQSEENITYATHVAPILQRRCVSCHREGDIGPMALTEFEDASAWADMILEVTSDRRMPPWHANPEYGHFANDRRMSEDELATIEKWVQSGAPSGNLEEAPAPLKFSEGWLLPQQPDLVIPMRDKPFAVPAKGDVQYQYFVADLNRDEDIWVNGMEIIPGNRAVVHHVLIFTREKGKKKPDLAGDRSFLVGYVPGTRAEVMEPGYAKRIPANSQLIFQVHYTPIGSEQTDLTKVGFMIADPATIKKEVKTFSAVNHRFRIPPRDGDHPVTALMNEKMPECELLSLSPHMHLRGKSFRYTALLPNGEKKILLDIPKYDFNWQTEYRFAEKLNVPKGTRLQCDAVFDNSERNLNNPNPGAWVTWGDQTYEEMMIGYFHYAEPVTK